MISFGILVATIIIAAK
ncbi:hypothetical protein [Veillonella sp. AS16]